MPYSLNLVRYKLSLIDGNQCMCRQMKDHIYFPNTDSERNIKNTFKTFQNLLRKDSDKINQTLHKTSLGERDSDVFF